jgi:signal transduction histidine kinase/ActR/RegA family two-component response regulator
VDVSLTVSPLADASGRIVGASTIMRDVTERRKAEETARQALEALRDANARLEEADRRKDEFIAILSHELRNPLAPIRYALPVLQAQPLPEAATRALGVIERQVVHLARLVDELLDVSRISGDKIELRREHVTLASVVTAAIEGASPALSAGRHSLQVHVAEAPIWLHADADRLAQVVTNILNNGAKYTPPGGQIVVTAEPENGQAVIRVQDNGIGIPAEALRTVFEMFRQVEYANKPQGGLGVGLALARRLVDLHGGTIEARSGGVGQGAEFIVRLPVVGDAKPCMAGAGEPTRAAGAALRVLIVDDNADFVDMLAVMVGMLGHDVGKALDGPSAISAAASYRPDVVLLDLGLPGLSGYEVARCLRQHPDTARTRLVALTGWGQEEDRARTRDAGFDHHLTKPTEPETLCRLLSEISHSLPRRRVPVHNL